jgi:hypothetical protein
MSVQITKLICRTMEPFSLSLYSMRPYRHYSPGAKIVAHLCSLPRMLSRNYGQCDIPMCRSHLWARANGRIKYVDSIETDTHVYIATERVRPLQSVLRDTDLKGKAKEEWIGWGVKSVSVSNCVLAVLTSDRSRLLELVITSPRIHQPQFDIHHPLHGMAFRRA